MAYQYPNLWQGCVGAWCPSVDRSRSTLLTDFSGRGNNGLLTGMDPGTDWVASHGKIALDLDGSGDRIAVAHNAAFNITDSITLCGWVNLRSIDSGRYTALIDKDRSTQWSLLASYSAISQARFICNIGGVRRDAQQLGSSMPVGEWVHLTGSYSPGVARIFLNGILNAEYTSWSGAIGTNTGGMTLGTMSGYESSGINGLTDDLRIYNRALDPSEVAQLASRRGVAYTPMPRRRVYIMGSGGGTRGLRLGSTTINKAYLGSTEIKKVYLGATLIHDTTG